MATDKSYMEKILPMLEPLEVEARGMFGEYGLFYKGKMFGILSDNTFFIRVTTSGSDVAGKISKGLPFPGAKPAFKISPMKMKDHRWLISLIEATADELPLPKKKKKGSARTKPPL